MVLYWWRCGPSCGITQQSRRCGTGIIMTDQELLQLLEDKSPQELSLDELRLLKQRLAESPALRDALAGQLGIDGNLAAALDGR